MTVVDGTGEDMDKIS